MRYFNRFMPIIFALFLVVCTTIPANAEEILDDAKIILPTSELYGLYQAAKNGEAEAQYLLGSAYAFGYADIPQNYVKAFEWFEKAARQGHIDAQFSLGVMYKNGQGVPQNYAKAFEWHEKAAGQGNLSAQHNLGVMYNNGQGVPQNYMKAVEWYEKAAKQGLSKAQLNLGYMHHMGYGTPQNYVKAYAHYSIASALGEEMATDNMEILKEDMSSAQIAEAQALAEKLWNELPKE